MITEGKPMSKAALLNRFSEEMLYEFGITPDKATAWQVHQVISQLVMKHIQPTWMESQEKFLKNRKAYYFSAEFLVGRAIQNNLLSLGIEKEVEMLLLKHGIPYSVFEDIEDAALGNGGLGRLAACFLDSAATFNLPLNGYGIRYKYGLFKQNFKDGFQLETGDDWTKYGDPWSKRVDKDTVQVRFADFSVNAVPYDIPIIGYQTSYIGTLRLWQAEAEQEFDFHAFNNQDYIAASALKNQAEDISKVLYPNDDKRAGKILRLRQQYFFCSASLQDIIKKQKAVSSIESLSDAVAIQLNDTHPAISIPELIRILVDEENMPFEKAFDLTQKIFRYTNHTIMAEALETWDISLVQNILPRIYEILIQINEKLINEMYERNVDKNVINRLSILSNDTVHMANLAVYASSYVNGVAEIHTEIIKEKVLKDWYQLYQQRFHNKTNGITPRRWLRFCNPALSQLISELLGDEKWVKDIQRLKALTNYKDNITIINRFTQIKNQNKQQLADYIKKKEGITLNTDTIFDIQIKRLHEYKRQLLNAFSILYIYYGIKEGWISDFYPTTFIFGAKAAPGYFRAKAIIKYIHEIAKLVNSDEKTKDLIKVVFVSNYNVSYAEKLIPAADVSEQISTAGTEASGTGNMKFMLNGTVTLGTYDGANIEIIQEAGEENNYIFGARIEELKEIIPAYDPRAKALEDNRVLKVIQSLIGGELDDGGTGMFRELYFALMEGATWHSPDHYYLIGDLSSYVQAKLKLNKDYATNKQAFYQKCWMNMCHAGKFSSDRTIQEYAQDIWDITPI